MSTEIEIDLYSGRPNPRVAIDAGVEAELMRELRRLRPLPGVFAPEAGLGYRGIRVIASRGVSFDEVEASGGAVIVRTKDGRQETFADTDRQLERWLLQKAAERLQPDDRQVALDVIARIR